MTRQRAYGEDTPFGKWMRDHKDLESIEFSLYVTDVDFTIHRYCYPIDGLGQREVHLLMHLEVKTRGGLPEGYQLETQYLLHQLLCQKRRLKRCWGRPPIGVWHFGNFAVSLVGDAPRSATDMVTWARFNDAGGLETTTIPASTLVQLIKFDRRPDTLQPLRLSRHHKTRRLVESVPQPLGFVLERLVTKRS